MATPYPLQPLAQSSTFSTRQRIIKSQFGDGYSQRAGNGLNSKYVVGNITNENISQTELNTLMSFWDAVGLVTPFELTLPYNGVTIKALFTTELAISNSGSFYNVSAAIEQVFDL